MQCLAANIRLPLTVAHQPVKGLGGKARVSIFFFARGQTRKLRVLRL